MRCFEGVWNDLISASYGVSGDVDVSTGRPAAWDPSERLLVFVTQSDVNRFYRAFSTVENFSLGGYIGLTVHTP